MIEIMTALVSKLSNDAALSALLGASKDAPRVFPFMPPSSAVYPCITYRLASDIPHDQMPETEQQYILDIWDYDLLRVQEICLRLDELLGALKTAKRNTYHIARVWAADLAEEHANGVLYHKTTRWQIKSVF